MGTRKERANAVPDDSGDEIFWHVVDDATRILLGYLSRTRTAPWRPWQWKAFGVEPPLYGQLGVSVVRLGTFSECRDAQAAVEQWDRERDQ